MRTEGQLFIIVGNYIINIQETEINHYKLLDIMKASELRIGNLVKYKHLSESSSISAFDISQISDDNSNVEPIRLTEEWLLKFGFKKDLENDLYLESTSTSFFVWQNKRVELLDNKNNICISHCKYVHQLQNLYLALTGEELILIEKI
jgi:hypothetical protein